MAVRFGLVMVVLMLFAGVASADMVNPTATPETTVLKAGHDSDVVKARMTAQGFSAQEIDQRMGGLTADELAVLAENPEQVQVAGNAIAFAIGFGLLLVLLWMLLDSTFKRP
jgi:hypothetical protein